MTIYIRMKLVQKINIENSTQNNKTSWQNPRMADELDLGMFCNWIHSTANIWWHTSRVFCCSSFAVDTIDHSMNYIYFSWAFICYCAATIFWKKTNKHWSKNPLMKNPYLSDWKSKRNEYIVRNDFGRICFWIKLKYHRASTIRNSHAKKNQT